MLAVGLAEFGGPEVLNVVHVAEPCAKRGEVLIRVVAATVNPTDTLFRAGKQTHLMTALNPPYIPGMEFAGYVHQLGDGSSPLTRGQPVMGIVNPRRPGGGTYAQYVCAPIESVVSVSDTTDLAEAATVPMNGLTAKMAIEALEQVPGDTILVTGGAGAVGGYAIQLAKDAGLTVIADAKESDVALLHQLGADEVVPRGASMFPAVRGRRPAGVDGLIDGAVWCVMAAPSCHCEGHTTSPTDACVIAMWRCWTKRPTRPHSVGSAKCSGTAPSVRASRFVCQCRTPPERIA
jgi:NADPH2:quinone reductase